MCEWVCGCVGVEREIERVKISGLGFGILEYEIKVADDILDVVSIECDATGDQYFIETQNEFGEKEIAECGSTDLIPLYVFTDEDE